MKIVHRVIASHKKGEGLVVYDRESLNKLLDNIKEYSDTTKYVKVITPGKINYKKKFKILK